ncbi:MAG: hypothetical protein PHT79_10640 [Syntrophomonadaceae bacterium]|nr:hypothetical protein [Syntrophomonadaceae bacterium]MDD4550200.1 hypothetical protein [Syntrophomonadaceae bacterium]
MFRKRKQDKKISPAPDIKDLYFPDRITEREDHILIDNTFIRVMAVNMLPEQIHFGWLMRITTMPGVTVSVSIHPYSYEEASNRVSEQQRNLGAELIQAEKHFNTRRIDVLNLKYEVFSIKRTLQS